MRLGTIWRLAVAAATLGALTVAPAVAQPSTVVPLRVEGIGKTLDAGTSYAAVQGKAPFGELAGGACKRASGSATVNGPNAMGLLASASRASGALRPLWVVEDDFGTRVCRVGGFAETDAPFSGWLYRVNHASPTVAADERKVRPKDEVLWYFANFGSGANTGDELVLKAPVRTGTGPFQVEVEAYSFDGQVTPAPDGTRIIGAGAPVTTTGGEATIAPSGPGILTLRAITPDPAPAQIPIPSARLSVCVAEALVDCPAHRGRKIVGSGRADILRGGPGGDRILPRGGRDRVIAGAGDDRIFVRKGGRDRVNCGPGLDIVRAGKGDRVARNCERVLRP